MTLGGLFSGIGGFELAAQWAGITPVWSNEIDPYCCKVLRKNFSHEIIEDDIRNCGAGRKRKLAPVDIICGGFPCQPFSTAGKRQGTDDDRYLWPEMLRIIRELRPAWVVGENVAGIISMDGGAVFEEICASLEDEGYQSETYNIPSCSIGAPHRRERIWIVAHSKHPQRNRSMDRNAGRRKSANGNISPADTTKQGSQDRRGTQNGQAAKEFERQNGLCPTSEQFNEHWFPVAAVLCRMDDGLSSRMDRAQRVPTKSKVAKKKTKAGRTHRLKGLGNAIVPQVAQVLFEAIIEAEKVS